MSFVWKARVFLALALGATLGITWSGLRQRRAEYRPQAPARPITLAAPDQATGLAYLKAAELLVPAGAPSYFRAKRADMLLHLSLARQGPTFTLETRRPAEPASMTTPNLTESEGTYYLQLAPRRAVGLPTDHTLAAPILAYDDTHWKPDGERMTWEAISRAEFEAQF